MQKGFKLFLVFVFFLMFFNLSYRFVNDVIGDFSAEEYVSVEGEILPHTKSPFIAYRYKVNDRVYISDRSFWYDFINYNRLSNDLKRQYPEGSKVEVFYNIEKSVDSVLKPPYFKDRIHALLNAIFRLFVSFLFVCWSIYCLLKS